MNTRNLIVKKDYGNGIVLQKYHKKVFWENLWNTDAELLECRGKVYHNEKVIALPFKKIFNYLENDTTCDLDAEVIAVEKINGFMFHATPIEAVYTSTCLQESLGLEEFPYNVYGTTGSLNSDFVKMGIDALKEHNVNIDCMFTIENKKFGCKYPHTYIFEIKDNEKDPHIIFDEENGVYLLGVRNINTGKLLPQEQVDVLAKMMNAKRPKWQKVVFKDLLSQVKDVRHEGFVVYDAETHEGILKIKSPFYSIKKWMMRRNNDFVFRANYKQMVDEEYYQVIEKIRANHTEEEWKEMDELVKGVLFEKYFTE